MPLAPAIASVPFDCSVIVAPGVAAVEKITVPLLVNVPPFTFQVIALSDDTVVFAATVVPEAPDVVVTVPVPPVCKLIVVADAPSDWNVNKPELGVIEILPVVLANVPVPPLAPCIVKAPDGEVTAIPLPDLASVIVCVPKSTVDELIVNVLLDDPGVKDRLFPKLNVLVPAVVSATLVPAVNKPVPDNNKLAPALESVSCIVNTPLAAIVAPALLVTVNKPLVDCSVKDLLPLVSIVPLLVNVPPFMFKVIALSDDSVVFAATVVPEAPDVVVTVPVPPVLRLITVAEPPSDWNVNKPEAGVIEILPVVLANVPVPPLAPSTVKAPDGEDNTMPLPDLASVTVCEPRSIVEDLSVNVSNKDPGAADTFEPKLNMLEPAVLNTTEDKAFKKPLLDIVRLDPEVESLSCMFSPALL